MRKIECIIFPFKLAEIKGALRRVGVRDMKISREFGRSRGHIEYIASTDTRWKLTQDYYIVSTDTRWKLTQN